VCDMCVCDMCVCDMCVCDMCVCDMCVCDMCVCDMCILRNNIPFNSLENCMEKKVMMTDIYVNIYLCEYVYM